MENAISLIAFKKNFNRLIFTFKILFLQQKVVDLLFHSQKYRHTKICQNGFSSFCVKAAQTNKKTHICLYNITLHTKYWFLHEIGFYFFFLRCFAAFCVCCFLWLSHLRCFIYFLFIVRTTNFRNVPALFVRENEDARSPAAAFGFPIRKLLGAKLDCVVFGRFQLNPGRMPGPSHSTPACARTRLVKRILLGIDCALMKL